MTRDDTILARIPSHFFKCCHPFRDGSSYWYHITYFHLYVMYRHYNKQSCQQFQIFDGPLRFSIILIQPVQYLPVQGVRYREPLPFR